MLGPRSSVLLELNKMLRHSVGRPSTIWSDELVMVTLHGLYDAVDTTVLSIKTVLLTGVG